eukprot:CAMPEP_0179855898 /NCGR_PEP_ID=MMETSP0982-20121206/10807_1 /TAXON_ID=483367 /ORGANISM="non described non described, Strain CCMP 2436" /LENGTH=339 /DNA_ID=CAMNT_0021742071 /DNA_START=132 /DNA_END=1150 /DNA_ORIENTATION=-
MLKRALIWASGRVTESGGDWRGRALRTQPPLPSPPTSNGSHWRDAASSERARAPLPASVAAGHLPHVLAHVSVESVVHLLAAADRELEHPVEHYGRNGGREMGQGDSPHLWQIGHRKLRARAVLDRAYVEQQRALHVPDCARARIVAHGDARVDEREGRGVDAHAPQPAVHLHHAQLDKNLRAWVEVREYEWFEDGLDHRRELGEHPVGVSAWLPLAQRERDHRDLAHDHGPVMRHLPVRARRILRSVYVCSHARVALRHARGTVGGAVHGVERAGKPPDLGLPAAIRAEALGREKLVPPRSGRGDARHVNVDRRLSAQSAPFAEIESTRRSPVAGAAN